MSLPKVNPFAIATVVLAVIVITFVGLGFVNYREFQFRAIDESESQIKKYFTDHGESLSELGEADYSLGVIEMMAKTDKGEYTVTLFVTSSDWVTITALNYFVDPAVIIRSVEARP